MRGYPYFLSFQLNVASLIKMRLVLVVCKNYSECIFTKQGEVLGTFVAFVTILLLKTYQK